MDEVMSMGNELIGKVGDNSSIFLAGTYRPSMAALIVTIVVGLLICLFGLKLMRLLAAVVGFVLGAAAGVAAAVAMGLTGTTFLIAVLAGAVIIGLLSIFLRRIGIFLLVLCYGFGVCAAVIHPSSMIMYIICLGIAVVLAVLSVLYIEPIVVVVTGISGGLVRWHGGSIIDGYGEEYSGRIWNQHRSGSSRDYCSVYDAFQKNWKEGRSIFQKGERRGFQGVGS